MTKIEKILEAIENLPFTYTKIAKNAPIIPGNK
jgi:hypothetical protein